MSDSIEKKVREYNREILQIKTSHPLSSGMKTFWAQHTFELEQLVPSEYDPAIYHTYYFEITYMDGNQPILAAIATNYNSYTMPGMFILESPIGNKQVLAIWDTGYGSIVEAIINSSRQILGIRKL